MVPWTQGGDPEGDPTIGSLRHSELGIYHISPVFSAEGEIEDFVFSACNSAGASLVGMEPEDLVGERLCELFPINRTGGFIDTYREVFESGVSQRAEYFIPAGHPAAGWWHHELLPSSEGVLIINRDVSREKRTERRLEESEANSRLLLDAIPSGLAMCNPHGVILQVNTPLQRMFHRTYGDLIGRSVGQLVPELGVPGALSESSNRAREMKARRGDESFPLELEVQATEVDGEPVFVCIFTDLTERKAQEASRLETERALMRLQGVGSLGLTAAGFAHDLNNLLGVIINNVELIQKSCPEVRTDAIFTAASQAEALIARIQRLTPSRNQQRERCDLREMSAEIVDFARRVFRRSAPITLIADPLQDFVASILVEDLQQLLFNLLKNAHDASPEAAIEVSLERADEAITLCVRDHGPGFSVVPDFGAIQPFQSGDEGRAGMGLGLFLVAQATRRLGGSITARNHPEGGAELNLTLELS